MTGEMSMIRNNIVKKKIIKLAAIFMAAMIVFTLMPVTTYANTVESATETTEESKTVTIEDEEVPLAAQPVEKSTNMSWWLFLIAIITATAVSTYEERKKDAEVREQLHKL